MSRLFGEVAGRFRDRPGGYTRIIKTRHRVGDAAELVAIELVAKRVESTASKPGPSEGEKKAKKPGSQAALAAGSKAGSTKSATT